MFNDGKAQQRNKDHKPVANQLLQGINRNNYGPVGGTSQGWENTTGSINDPDQEVEGRIFCVGRNSEEQR